MEDKMDKRGKFIVIDGMDGSGKDTQLDLLKKALAGRDVLFTREPGGSATAEEIRRVLLSGNKLDNALRDFHLFWAARASFVDEVVRPALARGTHVISGRYDSSSWAYQVCAEGKKALLAPLFQAARTALDFPPDAYFILDVTSEEARRRVTARSTQEVTRFDAKPLEYYERVRQGFLGFGEMTDGVHFINASQPTEEVFRDIWGIVSGVLSSGQTQTA